MTKSSERCYITADKFLTNPLLKNIISKIKHRAYESKDQGITEPPSTIVLTFESNRINIHSTTFKLIREVCINFKTVVMFNIKPRLFMALFHQLNSGISNIEMIKATTHKGNIGKSLLFCFAAENLFDVKISIDFCFENLENFLNRRKKQYTIYFPPYNELYLEQNELSDSYRYGLNYEVYPLLYNPKFINGDIPYKNYTNLSKYNDNEEINSNAYSNSYTKYQMNDKYTSIFRSYNTNSIRYQSHQTEDKRTICRGI